MGRMNVSRTGVIAGIVLVLLFFYVYQKIQIFRWGYKIRKIDKQLRAVVKENNYLQLRISGLVNPERIAAEVNKQGWDLAPPKAKQVIRVR